MGISGSLKDVSVADVMQFVHLGRRTGTLLLSRGRERAMIGFHVGRLVSAQAPRTPKLGDLLVSSGTLQKDVLDRAIESQGREPERRSLGQILVASGAIAAEDLRNVISQQIEQAVAEVMVWDTGTFEFAIDDLRPIDDIALYPSDVIPDADINTQMVLLEAARIFDERNRSPLDGTGVEAAVDAWSAGLGDSTHPSLLEPAPGLGGLGAAVMEALQGVGAPALLAPEAALQIVSADAELGRRIAEALAGELPHVGLASLAEAGIAGGGEPPIVLLDLRAAGGVTVEQASLLHRRHPGASLVALVDPGTPFAPVYAAGALAAVPPEVEAVAACVENVRAARRDLARGIDGDERDDHEPRDGREDARSGVARLRRVFGDLRSGLISATVALNLMHIISESVERAVLFLVKRDQLVALGAFGSDREGRPLAEVTRGVKLPLSPENALTRSLGSGDVQSVDFDQAALPEPLKSLVGRPRTGQVVVFPVLGAQRVISVIYTDNGDREEPIEDIDILELATAQVGMAFENELLRRQISQHRE